MAADPFFRSHHSGKVLAVPDEDQGNMMPMRAVPAARVVVQHAGNVQKGGTARPSAAGLDAFVKRPAANTSKKPGQPAGSSAADEDVVFGALSRVSAYETATITRDGGDRQAALSSRSSSRAASDASPSEEPLCPGTHYHHPTASKGRTVAASGPAPAMITTSEVEAPATAQLSANTTTASTMVLLTDSGESTVAVPGAGDRRQPSPKTEMATQTDTRPASPAPPVVPVDVGSDRNDVVQLGKSAISASPSDSLHLSASTVGKDAKVTTAAASSLPPRPLSPKTFGRFATSSSGTDTGEPVVSRRQQQRSGNNSNTNDTHSKGQPVAAGVPPLSPATSQNSSTSQLLVSTRTTTAPPAMYWSELRGKQQQQQQQSEDFIYFVAQPTPAVAGGG